MATGTKRRGLLYTRVSSTLQVTEGESLHVQRERLEALCTFNSLAVHAVYAEEGVSGARNLTSRPAGARMWADAKRGDVIVCLKLDRLGRSPRDILGFLDACRERGVGLVVGDMGTTDVTQGATAAMLVGILGSVAGFERERNGERVAEVKASQKARHMFLGGAVPFAHMVEEVDGQKFVRLDTALRDRVLSLRAREFSVRGICVELKVVDGINVSQPAMTRFLQAHLPAAI